MCRTHQITDSLPKNEKGLVGYGGESSSAESIKVALHAYDLSRPLHEGNTGNYLRCPNGSTQRQLTLGGRSVQVVTKTQENCVTDVYKRIRAITRTRSPQAASPRAQMEEEGRITFSYQLKYFASLRYDTIPVYERSLGRILWDFIKSKATSANEMLLNPTHIKLRIGGIGLTADYASQGLTVKARPPREKPPWTPYRKEVPLFGYRNDKQNRAIDGGYESAALGRNHPAAPGRNHLAAPGRKHPAALGRRDPRSLILGLIVIKMEEGDRGVRDHRYGPGDDVQYVTTPHLAAPRMEATSAQAREPRQTSLAAQQQIRGTDFKTIFNVLTNNKYGKKLSFRPSSYTTRKLSNLEIMDTNIHIKFLNKELDILYNDISILDSEYYFFPNKFLIFIEQEDDTNYFKKLSWLTKKLFNLRHRKQKFMSDESQFNHSPDLQVQNTDKNSETWVKNLRISTINGPIKFLAKIIYEELKRYIVPPKSKLTVVLN